MKKIYLLLFFVFVAFQVKAQETCDTAIDLGSMTSPMDGTTVGATDDNLISCFNSGLDNTNLAPDLYYSILVPAGSTITIGQTVNDFDSTVVAFYGDCTNRTQIICFDDSDYTQVVWANDTGSDQTFYWIQDGYSATSSGTFTLAWSVIACTNATAEFHVISDCANGEQFMIGVDVTSLGSATSVTVGDDQGSASQSLSATGTVQFGPFPNNTPVIVTISNDQDSNCILTSPVLNQTACPPVNDDAAGAILLTLDLGTACGPNQITGISNDGTTGSDSEIDPSCTDYNPSVGNGDLWYYIVAPASTITTNISNIQGDIFSVSTALYSGTPGNLTEVGTCSNAGTKTYTGLTVGDTYYLRAWDYNNDGIGTWSLCGYYLDCENSAATYSVVSDCANAPQFFVSVDVTSLGSASSVTVTDDQGSAPQTISAAGQVQFGPFQNNTPVVITIANDQNPACTITSGTLNQLECPPLNDNFADAIPLSCGVTVTGSTAQATIDEASAPVGFGVTGTSRNVWYSYTGSGSPETIDLVLCASSYDTAALVYTGTSGNLSVVAGNDDGGDACPTANTRSYVTFTSDGVSTYYIDLRGYTDFSNGAYSMDVICGAVNPPAVANQVCTTALDVPTDGTVVDSDNSYGDISPTQPTCDTFGSIQDVWFSFVAPSDSVTCTLTNGTMTSLNFAVYSGDCSALVPMGFCYQNQATESVADLAGDLTPGNTYYVQVWSNVIEQGTFSLRVENTNLSVDNPVFSGFSYHPNPVNDMLNLTAEGMSSIAVYNLLGQQVIAKAVSSNTAQVDMSALASGSYIVKVTAQDQVKTVKVIKN
ncbi:T9SS type A sorting domain-containing protein [Flavobacterium sp.]|uniref:T9SS type A sorting domain-containing protein n=1 Tax=Flavobacterium sp. TaxID=239 RepID=UPI00261A6CE9|nr:T9SS type A sorting domain-containing protein [Flavobacterium sp.]